MGDDSQGRAYTSSYYDKLLEQIDARIAAKKVAVDRDRRKKNEPIAGEDRRKADRRGKPRKSVV